MLLVVFMEVEQHAYASNVLNCFFLGYRSKKKRKTEAWERIVLNTQHSRPICSRIHWMNGRTFCSCLSNMLYNHIRGRSPTWVYGGGNCLSDRRCAKLGSSSAKLHLAGMCFSEFNYWHKLYSLSITDSLYTAKHDMKEILKHQIGVQLC